MEAEKQVVTVKEPDGGPSGVHSMNNEKAEEELYRLQAEFCKGMAHSKRIHILRILKNGEKTVSELAKLTKSAPGERLTTAGTAQTVRPAHDPPGGDEHLLLHR